MFRASDIFGRRAGAQPDKPTVTVKEGTTQKRSSGGPTTRTWDPATGQFIEEELPAELQELMGIAKKPKVKAETVKKEAWGEQNKPTGRALGPSAVGLSPQKTEAAAGPRTQIDKTTPSVEYRGFSKVDLNDRYYERQMVVINGRPTYWSGDAQFFIYWQGEVQRWSICDASASSFAAVRAGQYPGWAYKEDSMHLCQATGWMEAWEGTWREPEIEVFFRSSSHHAPQWQDPKVQKIITAVEFHGFTMQELNSRYILRAAEAIQGRPSYWDPSGIYFIYWQQQMRRWAICDLKCIEAVREGQCPGWAYRKDDTHLANACGWQEMRDNQWADAIVETAVFSARSKGLKVEFSGFGKQELNKQYVEKPEEVVQGRVTFWDPSDTYFIYWQSTMKRWAICDRLSFPQAKSGLAPGWAYRNDPQHFARAGSWMEAWGSQWRPASVKCTVLEGSIKQDTDLVKAEPADDGAHRLSSSQYQALVRKVYARSNPSKLPEVDSILAKWVSREHELFAKVCEKYQVDADAMAVEVPTDGEAEIGKSADAALDTAGANVDTAEVPELSATEYAVLVQSIYVRHNPKKLQDMGRLIDKYRGRERELYLEACKKYGEHPGKFQAEHKEQDHQLAAPV